MHFPSRHAPVEDLSTLEDSDVPSMDGLEVSAKAQRLLGTGGELSYGKKANDRAHKNHESYWRIRHSMHKKEGPFYPRSQAGDSDTVPGATGGAKLPEVAAPILSGNDSSATTRYYGSSTTPTAHQSSLESMRREFYDASKHPLNVSQQTSDSAIRDMALRKGAPPVYSPPSKANLGKRPLKSALKRSKLGGGRTGSDASSKAKKLDLASLFPHPKPSGGRMLSPANFFSSPASETNSFEFFPQETVHAQVTRQGSKLRLQVDPGRPLDLGRPLDPGRPSQESSSTSTNTNVPRVKVFEPDIYDNAKTKVYRPPKGIKNWFDGFDISSDEEEAEAIELPANEAPSTIVIQEMPSVFSPYRASNRELTPLLPTTSAESIDSNVQPVDRTKEIMTRRMRAKGSEDSTTNDSGSSGVIVDPKQGGGSRLSRSRFESGSVLSFSSEEEKEEAKSNHVTDSIGNSTASVEVASSLDSQRPAASTRKIRNPHSIARQPMFQQPDDVARSPSPVPANSTYEMELPSEPAQRSLSALSDPKAATLQKLHTLPTPASPPATSRRSKRRTYESHEDDIAAGESAGGKPSSNVPTEASRMMAVTEEEMILLELMRRKRSKMKNRSFTQGYRHALQDEQKPTMKKRELAHDPALMIVKTTETRNPGRNQAHGQPDSLLRDEMEQRRRLSMIRKEGVDKGFKMGRFFGINAPHLEKTAKMDRFLTMAPGIADEFAGRPISGTEIETESQYDEQDDLEDESDSLYDEQGEIRDGVDSSYGKRDVAKLLDELEGERSQFDTGEEEESPYDSREEDSTRFEEDDESQTSQAAKAFSPMQRLTEKVRPRPLDLSAPVLARRGSEASRHTEDFYRIREYVASKRSSHYSASVSPATFSPTQDALDDEPTPRNYVLRSPMREAGPVSPAVPAQTWSSRQEGPHLDHPDTSSVPNHRLQDSPDTPLATTWARPTSLKHPRPHRQPPALNFAPLESHIAAPVKSPSFTSSGRSPLTPTFSTSAQSEKIEKQPVEIAGSDRAVSRDDKRAPETDHPSHLSPHPIPPDSNPLVPVLSDNGTRLSKLAPPMINTAAYNQNKTGRITSVASISSAGEDVLAAWADLGGGNPAIYRHKKTR